MKEIQVNGPYFSNYSYARVNRGLALALDKIQPQDYSISIYCDPEKIDYLPSVEELAKNPELKKLVDAHTNQPHIIIYNNFPKSLTAEHGFAEMRGDIKIMYIAWEESVYPDNWVTEINQNLHGVMAATSFVREILRSSGVKVPIMVVPNAMEESMKLPPQTVYPLETQKKFKFLHISTAKKRKGVDVLLKAYFSEFTKADDVVLILKTFPGPDNTIESLLNELQNENSPEVLVINNPNLTEGELTSLILQSNCGVYPSRAEGFGLPILESMYHERIVIATNYSGYMDFCDEECAFMIDYKLEYANDSEFANIGAKWAEPDQQHLQKLMRDQFSNKDEALRVQKIKVAKERANNLTWEYSANLTLNFVKELEVTYPLKAKSAGVISFINDETGIAEYTDDLYKRIESSFKKFYYFGNADVTNKVRKDAANVLRLWSTGEKDFSSLKSFIEQEQLEIIHIQYHSGSMFSAESLDFLIQLLKDLNIKTYITLHAVRGDSFDFISETKNFKLAEKVIIHNKVDFEYAKQTLNNLELYAIPIKIVHKFNKAKLKSNLGFSDRSPVIATHGLMNKNKGIDNIVRAIAKLKLKYPKILFISLSAISSNNIFAQGIFQDINNLVKENQLEDNVLIVTEFLDNEVVNLMLQACDINIFAYSDAGESGSAAVRKGLSSENPNIVTDIVQFSEFESEVLKIPNNDPESIANAISNLLNNPAEAEKMQQSARDFVQKNNYETKSLELLKFYTSPQ